MVLGSLWDDKERFWGGLRCVWDALGAFGMTWKRLCDDLGRLRCDFGRLLDDCGAFGVTWGSLGMTWDARWSSKEALTLLQAHLRGGKGAQVSPKEVMTLLPADL